LGITDEMLRAVNERIRAAEVADLMDRARRLEVELKATTDPVVAGPLIERLARTWTTLEIRLSETRPAGPTRGAE
jgi:hypothetical protein